MQKSHAQYTGLYQTQPTSYQQVVAAKINRASQKMNHWDNMAYKLAEMKEVQIKQALQKENSIQNKIEGAQKRADA